MKRIKARHPLKPKIKLPTLYIDVHDEGLSLYNMKRQVDEKLEETKRIISEIKNQMQNIYVPRNIKKYFSQKQLDISKKETLEQVEKDYNEMLKFQEFLRKKQKQEEQELQKFYKQELERKIIKQEEAKVNPRKRQEEELTQEQIRKQFRKSNFAISISVLHKLSCGGNLKEHANAILGEVAQAETIHYQQVRPQLKKGVKDVVDIKMYDYEKLRTRREQKFDEELYQTSIKIPISGIKFENLRRKMYINKLDMDAIGYKMNMMIIQSKQLYKLLPFVSSDVFIFSDPVEKEIIMKVLAKWLHKEMPSSYLILKKKFGASYIPLTMLLDNIGPKQFQKLVSVQCKSNEEKENLFKMLKDVRPKFSTFSY